MKRLYLIGGPMGVGKTTVCRLLQKQLERSVFLDGDWCWDADPFQVTEETKAMVLENICFLLNNFIHCSAYENIVFCWVLHQQAILNELLSRLDTGACDICAVSLVCEPHTLRERLEADVRAGCRRADAIDRSLAYLQLYSALDTLRIDTTNLGAEAVARRLWEGAEG